jgi:hypothetical protein
MFARRPGHDAATRRDGFGAKLKESREAPRSIAIVILSRPLRSRDIKPEHVPMLGIVPVRTLQAVAAMFERSAVAGTFRALKVAGKLNVLGESALDPG